MQLRKLTMQGFKSFADRTQIVFEPGITAIVGPNGSGKSNIADAVRWVLGEQSVRSLRGARMEDVIFAGSQGKRALGLAEVSLTIDNSDGQLPVPFTEVTVCRRLHRSGESEYLINQTPCRWKDVVDLFLDTGVGRDAYAIVSQGNVEALLSASPEERRQWFETAAGIGRYRVRKAEALKKLEATEQDLVRLQDLLQEIGQQLEPLSRQAEKARQYQDVQRRWEARSFAVLATRWDQAQAELAAAQEQTAQAEDALAAVQAARAQAEAALSQVQVAVAAQQAELALVQNRWQDAVQAWQQAQLEEKEAGSSLALAQSRLEELASQRKTLEAGQTALAQEQAQLEESRRKLQALREAALAKLAQAQAQVAQERQALQTAQADAESQRKQLEKLEQEEAARQAQLQAYEEGSSAAAQEESSRRQRLLEAQQAASAAAQARGEAEAAAAAAERELKQAQERLRQLQAALEQHELQLTRLRTELSQAERDWTEVQARLRSLQEIQAAGEDFGGGVQAVLRWRGMDPVLAGIIGPVADLLQVPAELEAAIEVALGGAGQNVVVERSEVAQRAIELLKQNRAGRVTFLPLDLLQPRVLDRAAREVLARYGCLGVASDLVGCPERVVPAVQFLLGRTGVMPALSEALRVVRAEGARFRLVTLDGELVTPGGAITGGHGGHAPLARLWHRRRELQEKEQQKAALEKKTGELRSRLSQLSQAWQATQRQLQEAQSAVAHCQEEVHARRLQLSRCTGEEEYRRRETERLQSELDLWLEQRKGQGQAKGEALRALTALAARKAAAQAEWERSCRRLEEIQHSLAEKEQAAKAAQEESIRLQAELSYLQRQLEERESRSRDLETSRRELEARFQTAQEEMTLAAARQEEAQQKAGKARSMAESLKEQMAGLQERREALLQQQQEKESAAAQARSAELAARETVHQRQLVQTRAEMRLKSLRDHIQEAHNCSPEEVCRRVQPEERLADPALLRQAEGEVQRLRQQMRELEPVNLSAIDEYAHLQERHRFLTSQAEDLKQARDALLGIIARVDRTTQELFHKSFQAVARQFADLYQELFGGGVAQLRLVGEGPDLDSLGVEVMVQPPGKKLQHLDLLSGGEKALAAIALLFAFLRERPAPFCVLDEIDSALDDANVERFARLLQSFKGRLQLIVITHRQGTMSAADALYGVSMNGEGTSQLFSVRLADVPA